MTTFLSISEWKLISAFVPIYYTFQSAAPLWWKHPFQRTKSNIFFPLIIAANKLFHEYSNISLIRFFEVGRGELQADRQGLLEVNTRGVLGPLGHGCMCVSMEESEHKKRKERNCSAPSVHLHPRGRAFISSLSVCVSIWIIMHKYLIWDSKISKTDGLQHVQRRLGQTELGQTAVSSHLFWSQPYRQHDFIWIYRQGYSA